MAYDTNSVFSGQGLPTPTDTPHRTPSRATTRPMEEYASSSPPFLPPLSFDDEGTVVTSTGDEETISPLDPRRFTPNLHASLVSQILSLQREVQNQLNAVNNLEESLNMSKEDNRQLVENLSAERKENRATRKQMHMLESTTLSALSDIAKERDEALDNLNDTRRRLDISKSRVRRQEEEAERTQGMWDRERQNWDMERRNIETKAHLVEGRLRTVLAEVAAAQLNEQTYPTSNTGDDDGMRQTWYTKETDSISTRSNSVKDRPRLSGQSIRAGSPNFRNSISSALNSFGMGTLNGRSLAQELDFEHEDEGGEDEEDSPDALPEEYQFHRRTASVQSICQDQKAWKLLGLLKESNEPTAKVAMPEKVPSLSLDNDTLIEQRSPERELPAIPEGKPSSNYTDSGTQFSPLSSPKTESFPSSPPPEKAVEQPDIVEISANQRRKRVSAPIVEPGSPIKLTSQATSTMVSSSSQTSERPPTPPLTPIIKIEPPAPGVAVHEKVSEMVSSSTQTDEQQEVALVTTGGREISSSMAIPVIEIHTTGSSPTTSHNSFVLPPRTNNACCQANIPIPIITKDSSVQTEKIEVDRRPIELPLRSLSNTGSQSSLAKPTLEKIEEQVQPAPRSSSRRKTHRPPSLRPLIKPSISTPVDANPSNNDGGPLDYKRPTGLRRPVRKESLFAGFDSSCDADAHELKSFDLSSDDDSATAAPIRKTLSKVQNSWKLVPQSSVNEDPLDFAEPSTANSESREAFDPWLASLVPEESIGPKKSVKSNEELKPRVPPLPETAKQSSLPPKGASRSKSISRPPRRRSPSAPELPSKDAAPAAPPPFPVPTRSSSRKIPISVSEGAHSPTPQSTAFFSDARKAPISRPPTKNPLRKVRSAAAVTRFTRGGQPKTPTSVSASSSTVPSESPQLPRLPRNSITSRQHNAAHVQQTTHVLPQASLEGEAAVETPGQQTSVVDAIAQTMVGEWMWKYVRRRKSFGVTDDVDFDEKGIGNGIRHKRWVWLAPYERAIMWSSKQPTSGPALLGKNGRKCKSHRCHRVHPLTAF